MGGEGEHRRGRNVDASDSQGVLFTQTFLGALLKLTCLVAISELVTVKALMNATV